MINLKFFNSLLEQYTLYNSRRHELIKLASDGLRLSKQAIFAVHRNDMPGAGSLLVEAEKTFAKLEDFFKKDSELRGEGSYLAAMEEYVEAKLFYSYLSGEAIDFIKSAFPIGYDEYLSGICDLTGEMTRKAVVFASAGQPEKVAEIKKIVQDIVAEIIKFDLVGKLRVKYDDAKRNMNRLEEIVYDLSLREYERRK